MFFHRLIKSIAEAYTRLDKILAQYGLFIFLFMVVFIAALKIYMTSTYAHV